MLYHIQTNVKKKKSLKPEGKHLWRACSHFGLPVKHEGIAPSLENSVCVVAGTLHGSHQDFKAS